MLVTDKTVMVSLKFKLLTDGDQNTIDLRYLTMKGDGTDYNYDEDDIKERERDIKILTKGREYSTSVPNNVQLRAMGVRNKELKAIEIVEIQLLGEHEAFIDGTRLKPYKKVEVKFHPDYSLPEVSLTTPDDGFAD